GRQSLFLFSRPSHGPHLSPLGPSLPEPLEGRPAQLGSSRNRTPPHSQTPSPRSAIPPPRPPRAPRSHRPPPGRADCICPFPSQVRPAPSVSRVRGPGRSPLYGR